MRQRIAKLVRDIITIETPAEKVDALMAAIDSLIGDAARYRWLRDEGSEWDKTGIVAFDGYDGIGHAFDDALDAAIDAAIAASGGAP